MKLVSQLDDEDTCCNELQLRQKLEAVGNDWVNVYNTQFTLLLNHNLASYISAHAWWGLPAIELPFQLEA